MADTSCVVTVVHTGAPEGWEPPRRRGRRYGRRASRDVAVVVLLATAAVAALAPSDGRGASAAPLQLMSTVSAPTTANGTTSSSAAITGIPELNKVMAETPSKATESALLRSKGVSLAVQGRHISDTPLGATLAGQLKSTVEQEFFTAMRKEGTKGHTFASLTDLAQRVEEGVLARQLRTALPKAIAFAVLQALLLRHAEHEGTVLPMNTVKKIAEQQLRSYESAQGSRPPLPNGETPQEEYLSPRALKAEQHIYTTDNEWKVIAKSGTEQVRNRRVARWMQGQLAHTKVSIAGVPGVTPATLPKYFLSRTDRQF